MHTFPHLVNGPINEQQLMQISSQLINDGLPRHATPGQAKRFIILMRRHMALQALVDAYRNNQRSMLTCLLVGRYYANLERAIGAYRSAMILTH